MDTKNLEKIGFTGNESIIYLSLLKLGSSSAQKIVEESELHRSRVYDCLESLQRKGLVSYVVKDFRKYFQAVPPEKLLDFIEEQKQFVSDALPDLKRIEGMKKEEINASIYKGKEGLKTIHSKMLREGKDIDVLGAKGLIFEELPYFTPHYQREIRKKRIRWRMIWDNPEAKRRFPYKGIADEKMLPKGFDSNGVVNIFGDNVAIVLWKEKYPTGFMIENKDIADSFRKWFGLVWKSSKTN